MFLLVKFNKSTSTLYTFFSDLVIHTQIVLVEYVYKSNYIINKILFIITIIIIITVNADMTFF
ncbi:hypothetical protein KSF78_0000865 [Schistosoma japonicum]|nr:hypothetical protein KSF78_0000865 [Schistosoma japonicum]